MKTTQNIKINSAHYSNMTLSIPVEKGEVIPFNHLIKCCEDYFQHGGYLIVTWDTGYKVIMRENQYRVVAKHLTDNEKVFYLRKDCLKKS